MKRVFFLSVAVYFLLFFTQGAFYQAETAHAAEPKKATKKKKKKKQLHFTHKSVPVALRPYRQWGFTVGVEAGLGTGKLSGFQAGTQFGGYYCFKDGYLCGELNARISFFPPVVWGGGVRALWFPWSSRTWLLLGLGLSLEKIQVPQIGLDAFRFTVDVSAGGLWRAFSDLASTAVRIELFARLGFDGYVPYPFAPPTQKFVFVGGIRISFDFALRQVYRDGKAITPFTGRSVYDPRDSRGIYQNLQPHRDRVWGHGRFKHRRGGFVYRGIRLSNTGDADKDGILNAVDRCPMHKGTAKYKGCPPDLDTDNDGIPDYKDKKPLVPQKRKKRLKKKEPKHALSEIE